MSTIPANLRPSQRAINAWLGLLATACLCASAIAFLLLILDF